MASKQALNQTSAIWQRTLKSAVTCTGIGVHSGNKATLRLVPAEVDSGILFVRTDLSNGARVIQARWDRVVDTRLCTVLGNDHQGRVGTVEHLMAALHASNIDNLVIEIDGPEVPIMDGSAHSFVELIESVGTVNQASPRCSLVILKPVEVQDGNRWAKLTPEESSQYHLTIDFANTPIRQQKYDFDLTAQGFKTEISRARTFGFFEEGEQLRKLGLGQGCSLDNTVVIKDNAIMNEDGLRFQDEFVRHKLLDAIGDLALAGAPILGSFEGNCTGHAMNNRLLRALFADASAWTLKDDESAIDRAIG